MAWFSSPTVVGTYNAFYICLSLPKTEVAKMLPKGIRPSQQNMTAADRHPIYLIFGNQTDVTLEWAIFKGPGFNYGEFAIGVPFVEDVTSGNKPFFFMPRLYLNRWLPILIGLYWGFAKKPARLEITDHAYTITSSQDKKLISGEFKSLGKPGTIEKYPQLRSVIAPFGQKAIAQNIFGQNQCFWMDGHLNNALVEPIEGFVDIEDAFMPGIETGHFEFSDHQKGIVLGAYQMKVNWTMHMPQGCKSIAARPVIPVENRTIPAIEAAVKEAVDALSDNPEGRLQIREAFYQLYGLGDWLDPMGLGRSEIDFLRWEIGRGVLNPLGGAKPGSRWWRDVNLRFIYYSELAAALFEAAIFEAPDQPKPVQAWLNYLKTPQAETWYKAHNTAIIHGYLEYAEVAKEESKYELTFINMVLYRLLFAQAIVEGSPIAFGPLGEILADPVLPSVDVIVHIPAFYPDNYPLSAEDIKDILEKGHNLGDELTIIFDDDVIIPHLTGLYAAAGRWNDTPLVTKLVKEGHPIYPDETKRPTPPSKPGNPPKAKRKIAVLGGGVGTMASVFALTDPSNPRHDEFDITVYQMGWRLGGKGASGRNLNEGYNARIEEHGLHLWFGFYHNSFRVIEKCYKALNRAPDSPLAGTFDAFKPHSFAAFVDVIGKKWHIWPTPMPSNDLDPGEDGLLPLGEYLHEGLAMLVRLMRRQTLTTPNGITEINFPSGIAAKLNRILAHLVTALVNGFLRFVRWLHRVTGGRLPPHFRTPLLVRLMRWAVGRYWHGIKNHVQHEANLQFIWSGINFGFALIAGFLTDNLLVEGIDSINDRDFREWMSDHAYPDRDIMLNSPIALGIYYGAFAFEDGDIEKPRLEAGTALRITILSMLTSRGAMFWKFQAGMGDTIFAPFYEVVKRRGVKFEYFHRVHDIVPSADGHRIDSIEIGVQATLKEPQSEYRPLVVINGLPCWPSEPLYNQLVQGDELKKRGINLEHFNDWPDVETKTLKFDQDFDDVILGISLGGLPYVAGRLIQQKPAWKMMVDRVKTVRTQAFQLWMLPSSYELGWRAMGQPIVSYNEGALNTWGDMSHLVKRESYRYDSDLYPLSIAYFCGPMPDPEPLPITPVGPYLPPKDIDQTVANDQVKANSIDFLKNEINLWPRAIVEKENGSRDFKWEVLLDGRNPKAEGKERFDAQYWRANLQPSERYVLSVPGSSQCRLPVYNQREYINLFLAGDWVQNHLNFGCVEAGVISGLLLSNAMTGYPLKDEIIAIDL